MSRAWAVLTMVTMLLCGAARADTASEAELQYSLGLELYKQRRFEEALQHLIASNRLVPNANVVFNVAQTYGLLHRESDAFNWYQAYLTFPSLDDAARERGQKAVAALAPRVAVVELTTTPPGAEVFVDRVELGSVGKTPLTVAVAPGERTLIAHLDRFHEGRVQVTATIGSTKSAAVDLPAIVGSLVVESDPAGASVRREDTRLVLGVTPLQLTLPVGPLRLVIEREGYVEQQRVAEVREGAEARLKLSLTRAASSVSVLSISGEPDGAQVRLEERALGVVPLVASDLTPGSFQLWVAAPGFEDYRARIVLEPGAATRVQVHLLPPNGGKWRGLRWVGYGAGAAAVIAGGIAGAVAIARRDAFYVSPSRAAFDGVATNNVVADVLLIGGLAIFAVTLILDQWVWPVMHTRGEVSVVR